MVMMLAEHDDEYVDDDKYDDDKVDNMSKIGNIIKENHMHCLKVYDALQCSKFGDYHMAYLNCDVLILADVFENFKKTCISYYKLDPTNHMTAPSLAWDAMLLQTKSKTGAVV